jgi:hypothetical protein
MWMIGCHLSLLHTIIKECLCQYICVLDGGMYLNDIIYECIRMYASLPKQRRWELFSGPSCSFGH